MPNAVGVDVAIILAQLGTGLLTKRQADLPGFREHLGVFDSRLIGDGLGAGSGISLDHVHLVAVMVARGVQPGQIAEAGDIGY